MPSVNSAYWFLSALTAQVAVIAYLGMFAAAIKLKRLSVIHANQFQIYGGVKGTAITALFGFSGCITAIIVGFIPISEVSVSIWVFDTMLVMGIILTLVLPYIITYHYQKPTLK